MIATKKRNYSHQPISKRQLTSVTAADLDEICVRQRGTTEAYIKVRRKERRGSRAQISPKVRAVTKKLLLQTLVAGTMVLTTSAHAGNVYSSFEIFDNDFQAALDQADAKLELLQCTLDAQEMLPNCTDAVKRALETKIPYRTILLQLALKVVEQPDRDTAKLLNEDINNMVNDLSPEQSVDETIQHIIENIESLRQKYSP